MAAAHSRHHVPDALQPCGIRVDVLYKWIRRGLEPREQHVEPVRQPYAGTSLLEARDDCRARLAGLLAQFLLKRQCSLQRRIPHKFDRLQFVLLQTVLAWASCACLGNLGQALCRACSPSVYLVRRVRTHTSGCFALRLLRTTVLGGSRACGSGSARAKLCMMRRVVYTERWPSGSSSSAPSATDASSTSSRRAPPGAAISCASRGAACTSSQNVAMAMCSLPWSPAPAS